MATYIGSNFAGATIENYAVFGLSEEEPSLHQRAGGSGDHRDNRESRRQGVARIPDNRKTATQQNAPSERANMAQIGSTNRLCRWRTGLSD